MMRAIENSQYTPLNQISSVKQRPTPFMFHLARIHWTSTVLSQLQALLVKFLSAIRAWSHSSLNLNSRQAQGRINSQVKKSSSLSLNSSWLPNDVKSLTDAQMLCSKVKVIQALNVLISLLMVSLTAKRLMENSPSQQTHRTTSTRRILQVFMKWPSLAQLWAQVHFKRNLRHSCWLC